jgi:subtilase family serine protease
MSGHLDRHPAGPQHILEISRRTPSQCEALFGVACYTPQLVRTTYNVPSTLTGAGQTIVIVDAYGSPTIQSDLHIFDQVFGLPDPQLNILYPGGRPTFNANNSTEVAWTGETTLDVEWSHAITPDATIDLVIAASHAGNDLNIAQRYAVDNHLGNVMSLSFGAPEAAIGGRGNNFQLQQAEQIYQSAKAAGITVVAAAGDWGDANVGIFNPSGPRTAGPNALYPASSPSVLSVGGTYLFAADNGAYTSETAWNDLDPNLCPFGCRYFGQFPFTLTTGGAPSLIFPVPAYQQGITGYTMRTTADVAYNASLYTAHVHPHRFRHDTGRRLVEAVDHPTVAAWLGHERLDTVRIYSQPDEAALERAAAALEDH